ncbi:MAG TPA: fibronectin type III domain-containing protein [Acidobacteriaceae bacterium]
MKGWNTHRSLLPTAITVIVGFMLFSPSAGAQVMSTGKLLPPAKPAAHVWITEGPALESVKDNIAIVRWTSNNPGGSDEHFGIVHYGTDPEHLSETAKSHIRLNQNHADTVFRVRVDGLRPQTKYYYTVDSMQGNGRSDRVTSSVCSFTNP